VAETLRFAKDFAAKLKPGSVVALSGDLGSGKTTLIKGIAMGLGLRDADEVKSPTFSLMHSYATWPRLVHFDLYRLENPGELHAIGFEEFVNDPDTVICVEWPEKAEGLLPPAACHIHLEVAGANSRRIILGQPLRVV
jgi:tRNA threonylcarbamoyladenosine biosynthesis protein TsaE